MKYLSILFLFLCVSCTDDADDNYVVNCDDNVIVAGLHVQVKDAITGDVLTDGVEVVATDGDYVESLELNGDAFEGANERSANYIITVSKAGYVIYTSSLIPVPHGACHVITTSTTVNLQPE